MYRVQSHGSCHPSTSTGTSRATDWAAERWETHVTKLLGFIGATIGGWVGWAVGAPVGIFTAFAVSMVGTGVGLSYGRRAAQHWL